MKTRTFVPQQSLIAFLLLILVYVNAVYGAVSISVYITALVFSSLRTSVMSSVATFLKLYVDVTLIVIEGSRVDGIIGCPV